MQRLPVDSTDILSIGYDPKERLLEVEFKGHRTYQYQDVAPDIYEHFLRADSYGEYFYATINKQYRYKKVTDKPAKAKPLKLALVTGNAYKFHDLKEACDPFGIEIEQLDLPVDEIQSDDAQAIAIHKAKHAYKLAGRPVVINDKYWNILALRGFPGAYMAYVKNWFKPEDFLRLMEGKTDRTAIRTHTLVYYDGQHTKVFSKDYTGQIITEPRGQGDSFDQLVVTNGQTRTCAEVRQQDGRSSIAVKDSVWYEFANWYNLQRRLGKV